MLASLPNSLTRRGFAAKALIFTSPDGRTWEVHPAGPAGGYLLFEVGPNGAEQHDAIEGNYWLLDEIVDYLTAIAVKR